MSFKKVSIEVDHVTPNVINLQEAEYTWSPCNADLRNAVSTCALT